MRELTTKDLLKIKEMGGSVFQKEEEQKAVKDLVDAVNRISELELDIDLSRIQSLLGLIADGLYAVASKELDLKPLIAEIRKVSSRPVQVIQQEAPRRDMEYEIHRDGRGWAKSVSAKEIN